MSTGLDSIEPTRIGTRLLALIPHDGREPLATLAEGVAEAVWATISAPWHPAILARMDRLPELESLDAPTPPEAGDLRLISAGTGSRLTPEYRAEAEAAGAVLIEGSAIRPDLVRLVLERIEPGASLGEDDDPIALDFLALGTARWMLRDLTIAMGHAEGLDTESFSRETLAGARAWWEGDSAAATNRLRAAFELLTQARERFYPVDDYLIDLCLLDPATSADQVRRAIAARAPLTVIATARAIETLAQADPETIAALRAGVDEGWADVIGGPFDEVDEPLRPLESILWQYRKGGRVYRANLDTRNVETLARRRFGLYPMQPRIARGFGIRFALHLAFDSGRFPLPADAKRIWEAPDGSSLETITQPPLSADRATEGLRLPWRLARTLKDDHVATLTLAHWPEPVAGWYRDLRRVAAYSPVLARWVTVGDYFHLTDRPWDLFRPKPDEYVTPYLEQAVTADDPSPIASRARHAALRARLDALPWLDAVSALLAPRTVVEATSKSDANVEEATDDSREAELPDDGEALPVSRWEDLESTLETGGLGTAEIAIARHESELAEALSRSILGTSESGRPGFLVLNPLGQARRAAVLLPEAAANLTTEGTLRATQFTDEGVWGVVDLPAHGFAWVPRENDPGAATEVRRTVEASGSILRNESIEVELDSRTGGIRGLRAPGEPMARLGQQLVIAGLTTLDGQPAPSLMESEEGFEIEYGGPALLQAVSRGRILDPASKRPFASFQQRVRLWSGRPTLELEVQLSDLNPHWLARQAKGDPWSAYLACRWAWPDPEASLRRLILHAPEPTSAPRPETPEAIDINARRQRTALLFGGLAHHRRHGPRMLDTLLVAGRESERTFRLGVALDLEHPFQAGLDFLQPALVVPTAAGPPASGPAGWFFHVDRPSIAVSRVEPLERTGEGRGPGLAFHLMETAGRACRCRLRLFRDPSWARQTDFQGDLVVDLPIEGDAVLIDLTPRELTRVEVTLS